MKRILLLLLSLALFAFGAEEKKNTPRPKLGKKAQEVTLPAGAQEIAPYTYRYKDDQGKSWIYRRTPFGLAKFEDKPDDETDEIAPENMRAFEEGDSVRFERPTPFGTARWVRKKSELNNVEKAAWERELKRSVKTAGRGQERSQAKSQQ
jgi:hypothetical protein